MSVVVARLRVKRFDTEQGARQWARCFDHARRFNRMPLLETEEAEDGWWVVNPDVEAHAKPPLQPMTPRNPQ